MKCAPLVLPGPHGRLARAGAGTCALLAAVAILGVFGAAAPAHAQESNAKQVDLIRALPGGALPRDPQRVDMRVARFELGAPGALERAASGNSTAPPRATLIEMPSDQVPGQFSRPRYALGFRSEGMKQFARSMGVEADTCLAPLIRGRVSFTAAGDGSARLMVFARCSFH